MSYLCYLFIRVCMSSTYCVVLSLCLSLFCVPYVTSFAGLSILGYPFGIL